MVYDLENRPIVGVRVALDGSYITDSDSSGRLLLPEVTPGLHAVELAKPDYEPIQIDIDFQNETQVLYARLVSRGELLEAAERAIREEDWETARVSLGRAGALRAHDPVAEFLWAIFEYRRGSYDSAKARLLGLLAAGTDDPSVYRLLADIYEYHLGRPDLAAASLTQVVERMEDPAIRRRLRLLSKP